MSLVAYHFILLSLVVMVVLCAQIVENDSNSSNNNDYQDGENMDDKDGGKGNIIIWLVGRTNVSCKWGILMEILVVKH